MATILFSAAGAALGSGFGGTVLGLSGAAIGRAVGATVGRAVDQRIIGLGSDAVEVGRLDRFHVMGASEGAPIAKFWGRMRLAGQVIWASRFRETGRKSGGKGMPSPKTVQYTYSVSVAIALCEGEILGIGRIWADGDEISPKSLNIRVYNGTEDQLPDPLVEADAGGSFAPAYRGIAYVVVEDIELSAYGNRVPQFSFEVMRRAQGAEAEKVPDLQDAIRAVALIPGTGEYALAAQKIREERGFGEFRTINANTPSGDSDLITSLRQLKQELPNCRSVSLIVSWFGSDLRCALCEIQPKVEQKTIEADQMPWRSGGVSRSEAAEVPRIDGRSIYGGTPADASVIEAIVTLRDLGQSVMFYPFILMDQIEGNTLSDPYSEREFQAALPWRGRITLSKAPGRDSGPDQTDAAVGEVAAFFGSANASDFSARDGKLHYSGEPEWGYRRFILHYAHLCQMAGGVESFCIGSEMRGLSQIRGPEHRFPAVEALVQLAADVRVILGPDVKLSYAADWSEYFGFHADGNVYFHLDPLWSSSNIDFVGIDNYMPISDWREGNAHADTNWKSIYNIEYLKSNIAGGEGFDWFYSSAEGVESQNRVPIVDSAFGEDWVFRYKDLKSWWSRSHHNRINGERLEQPTGWIPRSKPIRFTEYGCAAIDKGPNEPNRFLDSRSSESSVPRASLSTRDDFVQMQYFRASHQHWSNPSNNPKSELFDGSMLDTDHCYAWAWDARPYPDFPRSIDVWSDGENYYRGHWLNGRATSAPLDRVVREVCEDAGVFCPDVSLLFGAVHGYSSTQIQSGRSRLQPLSVTYAFDCFEEDGSLKFQSREVFEVIEVSECELALNSDDSSGFELIRLPGFDSPSRLRFAHITADGSFSVAVAEAVDSESSSPSIVDAEYSIVLPMGVAKATASRWLSETLLSKDQLTFSLPPSEMARVSGTILNFQKLYYRVDSCEIDQKVKIIAARVEPASFKSLEEDIDASAWQAHIEAGPIASIWMDLPMIDSRQVPHSPFLAVAAKPWFNQAILWSSGEDSGYEINSRFDGPSRVGKTLSDLVACRPGVLDRGAGVLVEIPDGMPESISMPGLLSGKNLIAIGDGSPERWEIFQYMNAELISPGVYRLSSQLRGISGSGAIAPETWPAGSYVVLIDERLKQISLPVEHLNIEQHYRIGFAINGTGSEAVRYDRVSFKGAGLRPLSVCHLRLQVVNQINHHFRWVRRTRINGDSWDGYDVPLNEERELYLFVVKSVEGVALSSTVVEQPTYSYLFDQRVMDGTTERYTVEVSQISTIYGTGPTRQLHVDVNL
ncbi:MAG: glycoside hydrolase TIM-barrel-like domain-containing protein [Paracoccaceae bacterium]